MAEKSKCQFFFKLSSDIECQIVLSRSFDILGIKSILNILFHVLVKRVNFRNVVQHMFHRLNVKLILGNGVQVLPKTSVFRFRSKFCSHIGCNTYLFSLTYNKKKYVRFPRGSKKGNSTKTISTVTVRRKGGMSNKSRKTVLNHVTI